MLLHDGFFCRENEGLVRQVHDAAIASALCAEHDVIVDNTHLVPQTLKKPKKPFESHGRTNRTLL